MTNKLPTDPEERKQLQLYTFMFGYFPDAWLEVVRIARLGNEQHNPGEPLHWARGKSTDQMNAAFNHVFDYGSGARVDSDGGYHLAKAIWRLMAQLQLDVERDKVDQTVHWTPKPVGYGLQKLKLEPSVLDATPPENADGLAKALHAAARAAASAPSQRDGSLTLSNLADQVECEAATAHPALRPWKPAPKASKR